jgi:hypothetical protein
MAADWPEKTRKMPASSVIEIKDRRGNRGSNAILPPGVAGGG